jgi:hypothetical protein
LLAVMDLGIPSTPRSGRAAVDQQRRRPRPVKPLLRPCPSSQSSSFGQPTARAGRRRRANPHPPTTTEPWIPRATRCLPGCAPRSFRATTSRRPATALRWGEGPAGVRHDLVPCRHAPPLLMAPASFPASLIQPTAASREAAKAGLPSHPPTNPERRRRRWRHPYSSAPRPDSIQLICRTVVTSRAGVLNLSGVGGPCRRAAKGRPDGSDLAAGRRQGSRAALRSTSGGGAS